MPRLLSSPPEELPLDCPQASVQTAITNAVAKP